MNAYSMVQDWYVPDREPVENALARTTHLGIGAHQDDLEFMAFHGIIECFHSQEKWFGGIICTDGTGSTHQGPYANITTAHLAQIRTEEQKQAASVGRYSFVAQLGLPSGDIGPGRRVVADLADVLAQMHPRVIYTHSPADKHPTHLRVLVAVLEALRQIEPAHRPTRLLGCEMWRGLDWMPDVDKVVLDVGGKEHLAAALNGVFDSQIAGGKRYDLAVAGRRRANATLLDSHSGDALTEAAFAMDLAPLIGANTSDLVDFTLQYVDRFRNDIHTKLQNALVQ
ncbi:MAG: PIG-L deacetylase family protein [Terrimicrobiaceae bacterium]